MKKKTTGTIALLFIIFITLTCCYVIAQNSFQSNPQRQQNNVQSANPKKLSSPGRLPKHDDNTDLDYLSVSGMVTYKNLQVCMLYGRSDIQKKYVTLENAMKNKLVQLHETGDVNELSIDNNSDAYIYINSGDIVKGGKQDRTIQFDVILPPKKKNINLASFCVESGRWTNRQGESVTVFSASEKSLSSKELKVAAKYDKNQSKVWSKVDKYQGKANESINKDKGAAQRVEVKSQASASSLELTLDNSEIRKLSAEYNKYFLAQLDKRADAVGFAYFINGKLYSIDVFNNHALYTDLFDKLLEAAISEAISEDDGKKYKLAENADLVAALLKPNAKVYEEETVNEITQFNTSEHNELKNIAIFTTIDKEEKNWLHRNWLDKTEEE